MFKSCFSIILLILFVSSVSNSQQYWLQQPCPTTKFLTKIEFVDTVYGWASGDSGTVIHTSTGGQSWEVLPTGTDIMVEDIYFISRTEGWILCNNYGPNGTLFMKTNNSGHNWSIMPNPDTTSILFSIYFLNSNTGFTGGVGGRLYKTTNAGLNWDRCAVDSSLYYFFPIRNIKFYDSQIGVCCGGQYDFGGVVWLTTNGGTNWTCKAVSPEPNFDISFITSSKILLIGGDFEFGTSVSTTTNQGALWHYDTTGCYGVGRALAFRTPSEVWAPLSYTQIWAVSTDSGKAGTWRSIPAPDTTSVYDAVFKSPTFGWAAGCMGFTCRGSIMKYNSAVIGISGDPLEVPEKFTLYQNYPNPFNPSTLIKYYVSKQSDVTISIYDAIGRLVKSFSESSAKPGFHTINFSGEDFSSGVYFYKIQAGDFTDFKKMILLK